MKMRKLIIIGAIASALLTHRPAHALLGVGDVVFDPSSYAQLVQEAQTGINQLKTLETMYTNAQQQLQTLENVYTAFTHVTNVSQLMGALNQMGINAPMLNDAVQLEQVFQGSGLNTSIAGKIQGVLANTQFYAPQGQDFHAYSMNQQATASAGQVASAQDAYAASIARSQNLNALVGQIGSNDPKASLDLAARGSLESAKAMATANQLQAALMMQQAQKDIAQQQRDQADRASWDALQAGAQNAAAVSAAGTVQLVN